MQSLASVSISVIGGGNMARSLIGGLIGSGVPPERITVAAPNPATCEALVHDFHVNVTQDNGAAARAGQVVVLAVKPQQMAVVARALAGDLSHGPLVISVAAGIRIAHLASWLHGTGSDVVRAMPNRPALIGAGACGLYADATVGAAARALTEAVLGSLGICLWVHSEAELDIVTALSGSGPAYFFLLAELMAKNAVAQGLDRTVAYRLAAQTLAGAGRMVNPEMQPDLVRMCAEVASRGGTTEAAFKVFNEKDLASVLRAAQDAARQRSQELGEQFGGDA
ncbi:MAG: pyrroline-5-carboxylate reductase [Steroidobacteraceae bacterium]